MLADRVDFRVIGFISVSDSEFFDCFFVPFLSVSAFFVGGDSMLDSESEPLLNKQLQFSISKALYIVVVNEMLQFIP